MINRHPFLDFDDAEEAPPADTPPSPGEDTPARSGRVIGRPLITAPGFYPDLTPDQYFTEPCPLPALTNTGIKILLNSAPAKFAHQHPAIGQPAEERAASAAMARGSLVHRLALDKGDEYVISPHDAFRSNEAKAWKADINARGLVPVKQDDYDQAEAMAAVIRDRIADACDGRPYQTEVVIAWQEEVDGFPVWGRAMLDVWCPDLMLALDVKTCRDAGDGAIGKAFANGYATQDCWYRRGVERVTGEPGRARFDFLFVESDAPHLSRTASATEGFRYGAQMECERALRIFAGCLRADRWPGYADLQVNPPSWLLNQWAAAELEEAA